jgi:SAM-dependent methyltransferase
MTDALTNDELAESERIKYKIAQNDIPGYDVISPAEKHLDDILELCEDKGVKTILDAGFGLARVTDKLYQKGYDIIGYDFHADMVTDEIKESLGDRLIIQNIWEMPTDNKFDFIMLIDVMEHLPPSKVDEALRRLGEVCGGHARFCIALKKCTFSLNSGIDLHPSIYSEEAWKRKLQKHFNNVSIVKREGTFRTTYTCEAKENGHDK